MDPEEQFDRIDGDISGIETSLASIRGSLECLTQVFVDFRGETARNFEVLENRLTIF
jgi:hypothetical protein